jgi:hypothetical protein
MEAFNEAILLPLLIGDEETSYRGAGYMVSGVWRPYEPDTLKNKNQGQRLSFGGPQLQSREVASRYGSCIYAPTLPLPF